MAIVRVVEPDVVDADTLFSQVFGKAAHGLCDGDESLVLNLGSKTKPPHPGGMNGGFVDGSVRFLKATTPDRVWRALISISGHEALSSDEW